MCLCGNSLPTVSVLPVSMCSSKCTDATTSFTCGGPGNAELYNTSVAASEVQAFNSRRPAGWQGESTICWPNMVRMRLTRDLGCFANSANNVTADFTVFEGQMTVTRCIAACNELGYGWAGVQARERKWPIRHVISRYLDTLANPAECRCSKQDPRRNTAPMAANNFCAIPCNGDSNQRCGGWGYVDLYSSPVTTTPGAPTNATVNNGVPGLPGYQGVYKLSRSD